MNPQLFIVAVCLIGVLVVQQDPVRRAPETATAAETAATAEPPAWKAFSMEALLRRRAASERAYLPFLDVPALSTGLYVLPAGAEDRQSPHRRDEIYVVQAGRAGFLVDGERIAVEPGTVLYVKAGIEHRFVDIEEDLHVLVVFAPGRR